MLQALCSKDFPCTIKFQNIAPSSGPKSQAGRGHRANTPDIYTGVYNRQARVLTKEGWDLWPDAGTLLQLASWSYLSLFFDLYNNDSLILGNEISLKLTGYITVARNASLA